MFVIMRFLRGYRCCFQELVFVTNIADGRFWLALSMDIGIEALHYAKESLGGMPLPFP